MTKIPKRTELMSANKTKRVSIVIPTYNEKENVTKLIPRIWNAIYANSYEIYIVVVDDNSPDKTYQEVEAISKRNNNNVLLIKRDGKRGLGDALEEGFHFSIDKLDTDVIVTLDADLSHDPSYIPGLLEKLSDGYDIVIGSRYIADGRIEEWARYRIMISYLANSLVRILLRMGANDVTSNFRAYRASVLKAVDFSRVKSKGFPFLLEVLFWCKSEGCKIGEVPITYTERRSGKSKLNILGVIGFLNTVLRLATKRLFSSIRRCS